MTGRRTGSPRLAVAAATVARAAAAAGATSGAASAWPGRRRGGDAGHIGSNGEAVDDCYGLDGRDEPFEYTAPGFRAILDRSTFAVLDATLTGAPDGRA